MALGPRVWTTGEVNRLYDPATRNRSLSQTDPAARPNEARARRMIAQASPFLTLARPAQRPGAGAWRQWLFMGGRGAGKTRAGAEWLRLMALYGNVGRLALVGPTLSDVREVMIDGPSGVRAISHAAERPRYEVSRRRLVWEAHGMVAHVFSAEDPDSLRGPEFGAAWCDELASWAHGKQTWDTLQMAMRVGAAPRIVATTTPRPLDWLKALAAAPETYVTRAAMAENAGNLAPGFVSAMQAAYGGSELGRQELDGELIDDPEGALWTRAMIDGARVTAAPMAMERVVVAVDPPATSGPAADGCGIVAVGTAGWGEAKRAYVLGDNSGAGMRPLGWARAVLDLAWAVGADEIIAETNQGGEMVEQTLRTAGVDLPIRRVTARLGKRARAAPVAALYEAGRVSHVGGLLTHLEDEMCRFGAEGFTGSPDRVDALVWGVSALMLTRQRRPRVRVL